jgi:hypothetical protein
VKDRLSVLRALTKAEPMNLPWQTDQETFEKVRLKEIEQEIAEALAKKDSNQLQELYRELTAPGWRTAIPVKYRQATCTAVWQNQAAEFIQLCNALNYHGAVVAYQTMQQTLAANQMAMPPEIDKSIQDGIQWIQETANAQQYYAAYQQRVAELQGALDENVPLETLEPLYFALQSAAEQANQVISQDLEQLYHNRIDYLRQAAQYQHRVKMMLGAVAVAIAVIIIVPITFLFIAHLFG